MPAPKEPIIAAPGEKMFSWTRYWVPANKPIHLGGYWDESDGFLADPADSLLGKYYNKHLVSTESLLSPWPSCIILCGEPGMGKSQTLRAFIERYPSEHALILEFRSIPDTATFTRLTFDSQEWDNWRKGSYVRTVIIDGVDEGLIKIEGFVEYLTELLKKEPVERLQLILACRSLEWPVSAGIQLHELWQNAIKGSVPSGAYELCPLRDVDVLLAAETTFPGKYSSSKADAFLRSVRKHRLIALASRPLTLKMLLREYGEGGAFSRSHRELYRRYGRTLCRETDETRQSRLRHKSVRVQLSQDQRERIAGRIAALILLCGKSAIWVSKTDEASASDLTIDEIARGNDHIGGVEFNVTPAMVETVLESALFWPKSHGRVGFYHQTFAESFAADYLRNLPFSQIRSLLCQRDSQGEFVHPALAELAAWLAADSEQLLSHLLAHDPETLLRSDVSAIKEAHKAALVAAVLDKARAESLFDAQGLERFYHTLNHKGLAVQLRAVIHDLTANPVVRRMAFRIAEACKLTELLDDAIIRLRDSRDKNIHSVAAGSLDDLATPDTVHKLAPLVLNKGKKNYSEGVYFSLLHALLKLGGWNFSQALPYLEKALLRRDTAGFILAQHARPEDAEALLRGCLRWSGCFDGLSRYNALVKKAHDLGLARIHEPRIRLLLARVWWQARRNHQEEAFTKNSEDKGPKLHDVLKADSKLRYQFLHDLSSLSTVQKNDRAWYFQPLVAPEDFPIFLEHASIGSSKRRMVYAQLASITYEYATHSKFWDKFLESIFRSPELKQRFAWLRVWHLDAEDSQREKNNHYESIRWHRDATLRRQQKEPRPDPVEIWTRDLAHLKKKKIDHWLTLAHHLFYRGEEDKSEDEQRHDLLTSPGWKHHDENARAQIIAGARRLILKVPSNPSLKVGGWSNFDEMAYKALYLLKDEIQPTNSLGRAVGKSWLPTILNKFSNSDDHHLKMVALAYGVDAKATLRWLKDKLIYDSTRDKGYTFVLREFARCWDKLLSDTVVSVAAKKISNSTTLACIVDHLAEHDAPAAHKLWTALIPRRATDPDLFAAATSALGSYRLFDLWDTIWPLLKSDTAFAKRVFLALDRHEQRNFLKRTDTATPKRLADLFLYLRELFPPGEDPPIPVGTGYTPTARMDMARLRDGLPRLLSSAGTPEAADELLRISKLLPADERIWMRWQWNEAVVATRRKEWKSPTADTVLQLVRKADNRWLNDEDDLLSLVMESLQRLNENLTKKTNSQRRDFWEPSRKSGAGKVYYRPRDEINMSSRITTWLESDLAPNRGIVVQREIQVQWNHRTDIEIQAVAVSPETLRSLKIVIEVKGCWHPKVREGHRDQLVNEYLARSEKTHGIYLIVWTKCARWNDPKDSRKPRVPWTTLEAAQTDLANLVSAYDGKQSPYVVQSLLLDVRI